MNDRIIAKELNELAGLVGSIFTDAGILHTCGTLPPSILTSLTGYKKLDDIDAVREEFSEYVKKNISRKHYTEWMAAWKEYAKEYGSDFKPNMKLDNVIRVK